MLSVVYAAAKDPSQRCLGHVMESHKRGLAGKNGYFKRRPHSPSAFAFRCDGGGEIVAEVSKDIRVSGFEIWRVEARKNRHAVKGF